jgi:hypothetical protein
MRNVKVLLVHKGAPATMRRLATRVIDGSRLKAESIEGRFAEAKAIYNQMMGIASTIHPYEIDETDEEPTKPPQMPESSIGLYMEKLEDKATQRLADALATGIAKGVAEALASKASASAVEAPSDPVSASSDTMRSKRSGRPNLA